MNNKTQYTYTFIILLTLFFSFLFKLDISNGGSARDIYFHWNYIVALKDGLGIFMQKDLFTDVGMEIPHHYPLHHLIISRFSFLSNDLDSYLNFYFIFCLFLPILFYFCLDNRFPEVEVERKIFISSIIYFLPNYQASAIWGNTHITSLSFFLGSLYFLINLEKLKDKNINLNIFLAVFFLACAAYTRQYYVIFFPYLFISIIRLTKLKNIIFFCLTSSLLSIPGLFLLYKHPILFFGQGGNSTDFKSSILIVLSIIFIYLTPFFISDFKSKLSEINQLLKNKKTLFILFFLSILFFYLLLDFNYNGYIGGGLYFKISNVIIGNNIFFFIISFFSLLLCFYYFKERIEDIFLIIIISTTFSSGWPIFLKYFEPWLIFCMFLLIYKDFAKKLFKFNPHIVFFYFLTYWVGYFLYSEQFFKKINLLLPPIGQIF